MSQSSIVSNFFNNNNKINKGPLQGKYHKGLKDVETGMYSCPYCDFKRDKQSTVSEHITRIHPAEAGREIEPFKCSYCGDGFQAKTQLNVHISNHHEINYIECPHPDCNYKGKQKTTVYNHYARLHMEQTEIIEENKLTGLWMCKCCNKEFKYVSAFYHVANCNPKSAFYKK